MKIFKSIQILFIFALLGQPLFSQNDDKIDFKLQGKNPTSINVNQTFSSNSDITPIGDQVTSIFGLSLTADVEFSGDDGLVRVTLFDKNYVEYLVYETYSLLEGVQSVSLDGLCEETSLLDGVNPRFLRIEIQNASMKLKKISFSTIPEPGIDVQQVRKAKKMAQDQYKIKKLNKSLSGKGLLWVAGVTEVSELSYANRKKLYGEGTFPPGFEYYTGGVMTSGTSLKSATSATMVDKWDWRNRHGVNWLTPVKDQVSCGSCWAFATTGATEAQVNLFFNQGGLNLDLSEQDVLSCSGAGSCSGGYPSLALNYIASSGIVDEGAFPYSSTNDLCSNKNTSPVQQIKIAGKVDFGSAAYPVSEDNLKKMIIQYGPVSGGLYDWSHAMTLVGWQVVKEGDRFFYRGLNKVTIWITVPAGSVLIGKTVWIFKNSWGGSWGDAGYVYVETDVTNFGWTHALLSPVQSLIQPYTITCVDSDGDGYYWWGLGARPANCPNQLAADGDDSNASLGPLDEFGFCTEINATPQAPIANFTADNTSVTQFGVVTFTDLSTNIPTSWSWSFPGGTPATSTERNPVVTYSTEGTFSVSLTVNNSTNIPNTKEIANYISVASSAPVANFTADDTSVTSESDVAFTDLSTNEPVEWTWSFPGGTPSNSSAKNPVVRYNTPGSYAVSLTVKNAANQSSTKDKADYISVIYIAPEYCISSGTATREWIASVSLNGLTYKSGSSGDAGYEYIPNSGFTVATNSTPSIALSAGFPRKSTSEYWSVWIDFNQDYDFDDPDEQVITANRAKSGVSGKISIPSTALAGTTRMRVSMWRNALPSACLVFSNGEVEDYLISVVAGKSGLLTDDSESMPTLKIYPNPVSTLLNLQLNEVADQSRLMIFNTSGQMLMTQPITDPLMQLNVEFLPAGFYIILINNGNTVFREKFLKE